MMAARAAATAARRHRGDAAGHRRFASVAAVVRVVVFAAVAVRAAANTTTAVDAVVVAAIGAAHGMWLWTTGWYHQSGPVPPFHRVPQFSGDYHDLFIAIFRLYILPAVMAVLESQKLLDWLNIAPVHAVLVGWLGLLPARAVLAVWTVLVMNTAGGGRLWYDGDRGGFARVAVTMVFVMLDARAGSVLTRAAAAVTMLFVIHDVKGVHDGAVGAAEDASRACRAASVGAALAEGEQLRLRSAAAALRVVRPGIHRIPLCSDLCRWVEGYVDAVPRYGPGYSGSAR